MRLTWIKRDFRGVMHCTECHSTFTSFSAKTSQSHMGLCSDCQPKSRLYSEIQEVWTADLVALAAHIGFQGVFCLSQRYTQHPESRYQSGWAESTQKTTICWQSGWNIVCSLKYLMLPCCKTESHSNWHQGCYYSNSCKRRFMLSGRKTLIWSPV